MHVVGIQYRPTGHGKYGPRAFLSLINYLAELPRKDGIELVSSTKPFRCDVSPHVRLPDVARR
jgi:hypothetical protein